MGIQEIFRKTRSSSIFILAVLCFALFTIVPILPFMLINHGNTDSKDVQMWSSVLLASYGLALLLGSPAVGYFCDKYRTRKAPLICGFVTMALATALFISARSNWVLLLARVCQGLSGAVVGVLGLSMIAESSSPEHLGSHMACVSASLTWGMLCGPMTGGFLFSQFGTVGAFGVPIALLVVDIVLRMLIVQEDTGLSPQEDSPLLENSVSGNTSLSFYHFLHPIMLGLIFSVLVISSILSALESTLPLYVLETYHWSSLGAGLVFLPLTLPCIPSIPITHFVRHFMPRTVVVTGFFLMAVPMISLRWTGANTVHHQVAIISLLFMVGVSLTTVQAIIMGDFSNAVRKIESLHGITEENSSGLGRAYALCNLAFAAGQTLGPIAGGFIKRELGWGSMTLVLGILCLTAGLSSFFSMLPAPKKGKNKANENDVEGVLF
ncbi:hypothetical protein PENNAL_c0032G01161 [Penicillium nalgiovense]|uniref:Major facilitator superfamily (MFS) profile domain-containing protein n=1 Tax=Penicillium nalgiovense TaxID=60175 RepID=A0A1V6Y7V2_PENNA|nr:hypothetical protein PENNAL_c0032G01161 [Penicillium nalgiovense]